MSVTNLKKALNFQRFFYGDGPQPGPVQLHRKRVYIIPTRQGLAFAVLLFVMLLGSMNYNNSLGFLTTFILTGMSVVTIFYTNRNILNLSVSTGPVTAVFAGEILSIPIHFHNQDYAARYAVQAHFTGEKANTLDIASNSTSSMELHRTTTYRGEYPVGRLVIDSIFPFGLFRCWSYAETTDTYLVYPQPSDERHLPETLSNGEGAHIQAGYDPQDFSGLKSYTPGDRFHRIHWPSYAKTGSLHIKQFTSNQAQEIWLDWSMCHSHDIEYRLSQLCRWILIAHQQNLAYGLRLPGISVPPARGEDHLHSCLAQLAKFDHAS